MSNIEDELEAVDDDIPEHILWEAMLSGVDEQLARDPHAVEPAFKRAQLLWSLGRTNEAKLAYAYVLTLSPAHFGAINNLGTLLCSIGRKKDARTCYAEAVLQHPNNPTGHVNLANLLLQNEEFDSAREHYEKALLLDFDHAEAHQGLASLFEKLGNEDAAEHHRRIGFKYRSKIIVPYRGKGQPVHVLLLVSATRGNARLQKFLSDRIYSVTVMFVEYCDLTPPLPPHQLIINAIGNADLCKQALETAEKVISLSSAPVLNSPASVLRTGRVSMARRLMHIPGLITPFMEIMSRNILDKPDCFDVLASKGYTVPFLLRAPGFNNGRYFFKIENAHDMAEALKLLPGQDITVIQFLDACNADGKIRKFRVMFIDKKLYPLHLAISHQWKIHYITAEMADNPENRAEEEAFLNNMPKVLGQGAMKTLKTICDVLNLDYGGIDFSLTDKGEILLFETNATMTVSPPSQDARWTYRRAPIDRVMKAIDRMIIQKAMSHMGRDAFLILILPVILKCATYLCSISRLFCV